MSTGFKIFSDPVHGFISVPKDLILTLIQTPEVQRLRRIRQLGVGHLVFPGAEHTRFNHALGAMGLMHDALQTLQEKGTPISRKEHLAAMAAALLHDVGHAPFSHTLEHELVDEFEHERMSRRLIRRLNDRLEGMLDLTLQIFDGRYERPFFHQLVASQLDMDRLDYLRRDSFYTGVSEGVVGVQRIIETMRVFPEDGGPSSEIVVEGKGIYAVENFLISRRLMYWQVYLHKTVVAGDLLLHAVLRRVRERIAEAEEHLPDRIDRGSDALLFFLRRRVRGSDLTDPVVCDRYVELDDTDVIYSLKQWTRSQDPVLADLCERFVHRRFFRVTFLDDPVPDDRWERWSDVVVEWLLDEELAGDRKRAEAILPYYLQRGHSRHAAYREIEQSIRILDRHQRPRELSETLDTPAEDSLTHAVEKPYVCYPKEVDLTPSPED